MTSILVIKDWDDCEIYGVLEFANPMARFRATEIIQDVKLDNPDGWDLDDVWVALMNSGIEFKCHNDPSEIEEYYI